jgi:hypothetical protein
MLPRLIGYFSAAGLAFIGAPAAAQVPPVPVPCERACMEDLAGKLRDAFASRDASRLPLAANARYTEIGPDMGFDNGCGRPRAKSAPTGT